MTGPIRPSTVLVLGESIPLPPIPFQLREVGFGKVLTDVERSPQCPQNHVEADQLLRIPEELGERQEGQDEFRCLNVNVSLPSGQSTTKELLPVLIWIHGKTTLCIRAGHVKTFFHLFAAD